MHKTRNCMRKPLMHGMTKLEETVFSTGAILVASSNGDRISTKSFKEFSSYKANLRVEFVFIYFKDGFNHE